MRLAWTAIVPRGLVGDLAPDRPVEQGLQVLTLLAHPDPALCVIRCYRRDRRADRPPAA
ncbi:MAG TPA: hypothetical protein VFE37_02370 [Chloroflexota bacterium]|nr:hypothetical protein [Chloroflexota bacterium]